MSKQKRLQLLCGKSLVSLLRQTDKSQRGQTLLIVVLVMVIGVTVGLSLVARSITNLRIANEQANSQAALSAAEAGAEKALQALQSGQQLNVAEPLPLGNNSEIAAVSVQSVSGTSFLVNGGSTINKDDGVDVWLSDYSQDVTKVYRNQWAGTLVINWGNATDGCQDAALEIVVITGSLSANNTPTNVAITKYAADACSSRGNHFSTPVASGNTVSGINFTHSVQITVPDTGQGVPNTSKGFLVRIIPLYKNAVFGVQGSVALPSQGNSISATGVSASDSTTPVKRKLTVFQGYPEVPVELFPYTFFSPK